MSVALLNANALHIPLASESVQCAITSPPYFGLRDYGTAKWEGGSWECDHKEERGSTRGGPNSTLTGGQDLKPHSSQYKDACKKCGALRVDAQIGLERTPREYVDNLVSVFREVWRVLRNDGTLWMNLGDCYNGTGPSNLRNSTLKGGYNLPEGKGSWGTRNSAKTDLKPKDLLGIPWRVAFALQADGWYLRSDIIWSKPNPMPESVTDRPTKAHEYIFLLSKSERYYYDYKAIQEPFVYSGDVRMKTEYAEQTKKSVGSEYKALVNQDGRNKRTVWEVATSPYSGAHFATFPPKLVEPMVLAGSAPGDLILDPFAGTATVGRVAIKHRRRFVGLELNPAYISLAQDRTSNVQVAML